MGLRVFTFFFARKFDVEIMKIDDFRKLTRERRIPVNRRDTATRTEISKTLMKIIAESREIIEIR